MHATRAQLSARPASAYGIPASTSVAGLDCDKACGYLDACTVHRVPSSDLNDGVARVGRDRNLASTFCKSHIQIARPARQAEILRSGRVHTRECAEQDNSDADDKTDE